MSIMSTLPSGKSENSASSLFQCLVTDLNSDDQQRYQQARKKLVSMGHNVVHDLVERLPLAPNKLRFRIIMTICEMKDKSVTLDLIPYLDSDSPPIQAVVAQFLGESGDDAAAEALIKQLKSKKETQSLTWTIQALGKLRAKRAVNPLIQIMHETDSGSARYTAIEALGLIGDPVAISEISRYVNDSDHHVYDRAKTALENLYKLNGDYP